MSADGHDDASDAGAFAYYDDPENRRPAPDAEVRRRRPLSRKVLDNHVPVRFSADTIAQIREVAAAEGLSVSAWIRRLVDRELARQGAEEAPPGSRAALATARRALEDLERALVSPPAGRRRAR